MARTRKPDDPPYVVTDDEDGPESPYVVTDDSLPARPDSAAVTPTPAPRRGLLASVGEGLSRANEFMSRDRAEQVKRGLTDSAWGRFVTDNGVSPLPTTQPLARPGARPAPPRPRTEAERMQDSFAPQSTATTAGRPAEPEPAEGTINYRDPKALRETRASARRIWQDLSATNPRTGEAYTLEERQLARMVDRNLGVREDLEDSKGGFWRRTLDNIASGQVSGEAYREIRRMQEAGEAVTPDDLVRLGVTTRDGETMRTDPTMMEGLKEELLPTMAGQLPYLALGAENVLLRGGAAMARGARMPTIARGLQAAGNAKGITGATFAQRAGQRAVVGATQGAPTGFALDVATEHARGADPLEATAVGLAGAVLGAGLGAPLEVGAGAAFDALAPIVKRGYRTADEALTGAIQPFTEPLAKRLRESAVLNKIGQVLSTPEAAEAMQAVDVARAADDKLPASDKTPEAALREIAGLLEARRAEVDAATTDPMVRLEQAAAMAPAPDADAIVPGAAMRPRPEADPNTPLPTAAQVAAARVPDSPTDGANAVRKMELEQQRQAAEAAFMAEEQARIANDPNVRLEQAAQARPGEKQGPLTLAQTIARAGREAEAGDPIATEYRQAIDAVVDATATVRDKGEKVTTTDRVKLARATRALNAAREKYGRQFGASAVLALAAAGEGLSDEEAEGAGVGDVLTTAAAAAVPIALPRRLRKQLLTGVADYRQGVALRPHDAPDDVMGASDWAQMFDTFTDGDSNVEAIKVTLHSAFGDRKVGIDEVEMAFKAAPDEPRDQAFYSRLRVAVEDRQAFPKKWDEPRPAADWIGKLKGSNAFSKQELQLVLPKLEAMQATKQKVGRQQLLDLIDESVPEIERLTLSNDPVTSLKLGNRMHDPNTVGDDIVDIDDIPAERDEITDQMALRQRFIEEERERIETAQQEREEEMNNAESAMNDARREANEAANEFDGGDTAIEMALDYLDEVVEGEYIPNRAIARAMERFHENAYAPSRTLEDADWVVRRTTQEEEKLFVIYDGEGDEVGTESSLEDAQSAWPEEDGYRIEPAPDDHEDREWIILDDGYETKRLRADFDEDRARSDAQDLLNEYDSESFYESDAWGEVQSALEIYAQRRADYMAAESAHNYATEGDEFTEELETVEAFERELEVLQDRLNALPTMQVPAWFDTHGYYELSTTRQARADRLREMGAIGTQGDVRGEFTSTTDERMAWEAVFNEDEPHFPLPRPYEPTPADPDQLSMFGEGSFAPPPEAETDNLMPIRPPVHGKPKYPGTQVVPGVTEYVEQLTVWSNNTGESYRRNHYGHISPNIVGHIRAGTYEVTRYADISDFETLKQQVPAIAADKQALDLRGRVIERRKEIEGVLAKQAALVEEQGRLTQATMPEDIEAGVRPRLEAMAREYRVLDQQLETMQAAEEKLLDELMNRLHTLSPVVVGGKRYSEPEKVRVLIESQSDWGQDAGKQGIKQPIDEAEKARRTEALRVAEEQLDALQQANGDTRRAYYDQIDDVIGPMLETAYANDGVRQAFFARFPRSQDNEWPTASEVRSTIWEDHYNWLEQYVPGLREERAKAFELGAAYDRAHEAATAAMSAKRAADRAVQEINYQTGVPASPFLTGGGVQSAAGRFDVDSSAAFKLNVARFLLDAAERMYPRVAWSTAANRISRAGLPAKAARLVYDELTPGAVKALLGGLGFKEGKDYTIERLMIRGFGHHSVRMSDEMIRAIRKRGFPILSVLALAAAPSTAEAQGSEKRKGEGGLWGTALGGVAAGTAITALAGSRALRRMVKQNAELQRALALDDLSGLGSARAFRAAKDRLSKQQGMSFVVFDGNQFKAMNDAHGHTAGDNAIQHFGRIIREVMEEHGIPAQAFRYGGDEFAVAVPDEIAVAVRQAIEERSAFRRKDVTTSLTGEIGHTFEQADVKLMALKNAMKEANPLLRRAGDYIVPPEKLDEVLRSGGGGGLQLHANPIGPALRTLARYPSATALAALGYGLSDNDDEALADTGKAVIGLAALHAIGARRILRGGEKLGAALLDGARRSETGTAIARFLNPEALLTPEVRAAVAEFEMGLAKGKARGNEFSGKAKALGPQGDRAVSDVLENEGWEDTSTMSADDLTAVLTVAAELAAEYADLSAAKVAAGVLEPEQVIPDYGGPRRYAKYAAEDALNENPRPGSKGPSGKPRIGEQKRRTLDIPIHEAERDLALVIARGGSAAEIDAARDAVERARAVQLMQRVERGEIREASYRAAEGITRSHADVAAAQLFETIAASPGAMHPEWLRLKDDQATAEALLRANPKDADLLQMVRDIEADLAKIESRFKQREGEYVTLSGSKALGKLRGAVVQRDIAHSIKGIEDFGGAVGKVMQFWKEIKTVFNPGTHLANVVSNIGFAHMNGLSMPEQVIYLPRAANDMKAYGPATRALAEAGVLDNNVVTGNAEGTIGRDMRSEEGLEELLDTTRPETAALLREGGITEERKSRKYTNKLRKGAATGATLGALATADDEEPEYTAGGAVAGAIGGTLFAKRGVRGGARSLYSNEDNIFRVAVYMQRRKAGDTEREAIEFAREAFGNFRTRSPALNLIRGTVSPFILYPAKAVPKFAELIVDHPWRYMTFVAMATALHEYSEAEVGEVPEHDLAVRDRPGALGRLLPGLVQLPFKNERGEKAMTDVSRWTPLSALTTAAPPGAAGAVISDEYPALFQPSGPLVDLAAKAATGRDTYSGRPLVRRDYPLGENLATTANEVGRTFLPPAAGFHADRVKQDIQNRDMDKLRTDLMGPTGLRPRYIRPGGNTRAAVYQLQASVRDMKYELQRELIANKNPARQQVIVDRFKRRIASAVDNFRERMGEEPPADVLDELLAEP